MFFSYALGWFQYVGALTRPVTIPLGKPGACREVVRGLIWFLVTLYAGTDTWEKPGACGGYVYSGFLKRLGVGEHGLSRGADTNYPQKGH